MFCINENRTGRHWKIIGGISAEYFADLAILDKYTPGKPFAFVNNQGIMNII